ncbi:MAG TPA: trehalase family glycosidase, partial [Candidatus Paceibacterota bacterium]
MDIAREARKVMEENRCTTGGYIYTQPSKDHYPYQWLWDSCFHAIILSHYDPAAAQEELRSLLSRQFKDGMVPHIIYWSSGILHLFRWGMEGTSSITQPPMIAYAAWQVHRSTFDKAFLESIYPALLAYYRFLIDKRDPRDHHLIGIINPDESGEDNSPRFDGPLSAAPDISAADHLALRAKLVAESVACKFDAELCMRDYFWVKDVLFNTVLIENLRALAQITAVLKDAEGEHFARLHAELVAEAMREYLFEGGVYWSASGAEYAPLRVATWNHFVPLFAGLYTSEEAEHVVRTHLLNPDTFNAPLGIRTVSREEQAYRGAGYDNDFSWRGPVWMAPHWFIYHGLVRYGYAKEAADIRAKSIALLER